MNRKNQTAGSGGTEGPGDLKTALWYASWLNYAAFLISVPLSRHSSFLAQGHGAGGAAPLVILCLLSAWLGALVGIGIVFLFSQGWAHEFGNWSDRPSPTDGYSPEESSLRSLEQGTDRGEMQRRSENRALRALIGSGIVVSVTANFAALKLAAEAGESWQAGGIIGGIAEVLRLILIATGNLGLLMAATALGILVARGLLKPNYLVMAAIVGALTDIFSVYAGPTKHVLTSEALPYVSYQWGVAGQGVIPCVGIGDFLFLSLYFAGARRFGLDERKTFWAMAVAFALGYISLLWSPQGIPALPFMAALLLLVHAPQLRLLLTRARVSSNL
jgi:hypothetical protein